MLRYYNIKFYWYNQKLSIEKAQIISKYKIIDTSTSRRSIETKTNNIMYIHASRYRNNYIHGTQLQLTYLKLCRYMF